MARSGSDEFMAVGSVEFIFACMFAFWCLLTAINWLG